VTVQEDTLFPRRFPERSPLSGGPKSVLKLVSNLKPETYNQAVSIAGTDISSPMETANSRKLAIPKSSVLKEFYKAL
jgi:hypothetical protein